MPVYVVEPEESLTLEVFLSSAHVLNHEKPRVNSLKLIVSHSRLKKFRFPGPFESPSTLGSNHLQRYEDKKVKILILLSQFVRPQ